MKTQIYVTRKLEKTLSKNISKEVGTKNQYLGKWSANIFYVSKKKCWLLANSRTKYILVLSNIKKNDLKNISNVFKETFYSQLIYDGIIVDYNLISKIIGEIELCETDNDRSTNSYINYSLLYFKDWKYEFKNYENMPFRDLNNRLNSLPSKMLNWKRPREKMDELIKTYA